MKKLQTFSQGLLLAAVIAGLTGCVPLVIGAVAGAGGITYAKGAVSKNYANTFEEVHEAVLGVLKDFGIFVLSDELNTRSAIIKGEYDDGQSIQVIIDALTERASTMTVRIGVFGDQDESIAIFTATEKRL